MIALSKKRTLAAFRVRNITSDRERSHFFQQSRQARSRRHFVRKISQDFGMKTKENRATEAGNYAHRTVAQGGEAPV
ncbi:hypothetical protein BGLA2_180076 [Burkholderia gladioli]|nr:hypothetical protein BGLA2_180076 [Burkholderia gladioli]